MSHPAGGLEPMARTSRTHVLELAANQLGLFTSSQAHELGLSRSTLQHWNRCGGISRAGRSVWAVDGSPDSELRRALAIALDMGPGTVFARSSAAWVWRVPGHRLDPTELLRDRGARPSPSSSSHSSRLFDASDVTIRQGLPVTTPVRTIFDLAGDQHVLRTRRDLNNLMGRGLVRLDQLEHGLSRLARRGRPGVAAMRRLIDEARDKAVPAGSNLELVVEDLLQRAGFQNMERQVPLYDEQGFIARVDFGDRERRFAVEVDSDRFHSGLVDRAVDGEKADRIDRIGWTLVRITEKEIWWNRAGLVARLVDARRQSSNSHANLAS